MEEEATLNPQEFSALRSHCKFDALVDLNKWTESWKLSDF
jgi:hypothetical protein